MNEIIPDVRCTGCNQCVAVCPKHAIRLSISREGFWYPYVDSNVCIDCGVCLKRCPVYGRKPEGFNEPVCYVARCDDDSVRMQSSSGGIFSLLSENVLREKGVVYGAAYDDGYAVSHIRIDSMEDLARIRGSKYVQSYISESIYSDLDKDIKEGRAVLFSGTPCQTAAVNKLWNGYKNLLTVDIICHRVPSPKAWNKYLNELSNGRSVDLIDMRRKLNGGWNRYHMFIHMTNGDQVDETFIENIWGKSFVHNLFLRKSCYSCEFKEVIRCADISLGDFWSAARGLHKDLDDGDKGVSMVLLNSAKGIKAFGKIDCFKTNIPYKWAEDENYAVRKSSGYNAQRDAAFRELDKESFSRVVFKYTRTSFGKRLKRIASGHVKKFSKESD